MLDFARGCSGMRWRASSRERWLWGKSSCATTSMPQWGSQAGQGYPVAREEPAPDVWTKGKSYRQQFIRNRGLPTTARRGSLAGPPRRGSWVRLGGNGFRPPFLSATMGHPPLRVKIVPTLRQAQGRLLSPKEGDKSGAPMGISDP